MKHLQFFARIFIVATPEPLDKANDGFRDGPHGAPGAPKFYIHNLFFIFSKKVKNKKCFLLYFLYRTRTRMSKSGVPKV